MTVWISYANLPVDAPDIGVQTEACQSTTNEHEVTEEEKPEGSTILSLFGNNEVNAWLEDERRIDGLALYQMIPITIAQVWLCTWPVGRIFNELADLHWERQPDGMIHLVMISAATLPDVFRASKLNLKPLTDKPECILLWGEWRVKQTDVGQQKGWDEGRIPDVGRFYPSEWKQSARTAPRAAIVVQTYETDGPTATSLRVVTRYVRYEAEYTPPFDSRFMKRTEEL
jgi:hypothetical protein